MTEQPTYAVPLDLLEQSVHVATSDMVETQPDPAVPHDLPFEDMALGRAPRPRA